MHQIINFISIYDNQKSHQIIKILSSKCLTNLFINTFSVYGLLHDIVHALTKNIRSTKCYVHAVRWQNRGWKQTLAQIGGLKRRKGKREIERGEEEGILSHVWQSNTIRANPIKEIGGRWDGDGMKIMKMSLMRSRDAMKILQDKIEQISSASSHGGTNKKPWNNDEK